MKEMEAIWDFIISSDRKIRAFLSFMMLMESAWNPRRREEKRKELKRTELKMKQMEAI